MPIMMLKMKIISEKYKNCCSKILGWPMKSEMRKKISDYQMLNNPKLSRNFRNIRHELIIMKLKVKESDERCRTLSKRTKH